MKINKKDINEDPFVVGVDFGESTTGLALGRGEAVTPVSSVNSKDKMFAVQQISRLALENKAAKIVVGLPLDMSGKETKESLEVRRFAKMLRAKLGIPVDFINESDTTSEAMAEALESGIPQKSRKRIDSISASIILKRYFSKEN